MAIHFKLLLVLVLCSLSVSGDLLWSIDCGTPGTTFSNDANFITWMGDGDLFQTGSSTQQVQSSSSISEVMDTLRVFTSRKKNCYNLKVDKDTQVLVRASFNYGNYDKKSSPPTFDLHFDGNFWVTVETSGTNMVYYEVVYVVKRNYLSVCVAQTKPNQFPFISALEVRGLDSHMYSQVNSSVAMILQTRVAYGADSAIRYTDDSYDRIWEPANVRNGQVKVTNEAIIIDNAYVDDPPHSVLQNAISTSSTSDPLILDSGLQADTSSQVYINWYFSEVTELDSTQRRSFQIFKNNESLSRPILPPYENVTELFVVGHDFSSTTTLSLVATTDSDLPPLINGMEVFTISDVLTGGTNINDVDSLVSLQNTFNVLSDWGGDPCLPSPYSWEWVNCSSDAIPRITAINLNSFGLDGLIPDLSSMDALEVINLQNNSLVGPVPDSLGTLPKLKRLNLANNKLSGPIPPSLSKNNKLDLVWTGNPSLCKSGCQVSETPGYDPANPSSDGGYTPVYVPASGRGSKKSKSKAPVIVGTTIPSFVFFWAIVGLVVVLRRRRAAVAAATTGGANRPNGKPHGGSNVGEAVMNEFKVNIEQQANVDMSGAGGETSDQPQPQPQPQQ